MVDGYSRPQIALHWVVAGLVALQLLYGDAMSDAFEARVEDGAPGLPLAAAAHIASGALVLLLVFWRLALRRERGVPPPPARDPPWQRAAARGVHAALYALLLLAPVAGAVAWGNGSEAAGEVHETLATVILALAALHAAAAVYGQVVQKSGVLARMLRPRG